VREQQAIAKAEREARPERPVRQEPQAKAMLTAGPRLEARTRAEAPMAVPALRAELQAKQTPEQPALAPVPEPIQRVPPASAAIAARRHHCRMHVFARRHAKAARHAAGSLAFTTFAQSRRSALRDHDGSSTAANTNHARACQRPREIFLRSAHFSTLPGCYTRAPQAPPWGN